ncbi:hypothetical protein HPP92_025150 [Vanilla planifolia]|uniref:Myb-like domain-containing protein n=1 Tax=Vanilla planifolia TaxID=51239 RepID=A0A835PHC2_VANPL|nr:hypothetical protein HPP92_025150 [Vanilla planifolia]
MEFVEEDVRPRLLFQARSVSSSHTQPEKSKISKVHAACCISAAAALLAVAFSISSHTSIFFTLLIWISSSFLLAPFAPSSATGGEPRVGCGDVLPPLVSSHAEADEPRRRSASRFNPKQPPPHPLAPVITASADPLRSEEKRAGNPVGNNGGSAKTEPKQGEEEWTDEDFEILKRQILKHPSGAPGRWDRVAEAFNGRHEVESVIRASKFLSERRPAGGDSFAQFLKQRKPVDKRVDAAADGDAAGDRNTVEPKGESVAWSSGEDITLLSALKAFPKDSPMRWEKVAATVPGKSKAQCMKRVAELKRDFRNSKVSDS